ncbi:Ppx/GppA family phosphatase [bacterium]|nr:MAG: Ppx/GppA family phosphatase [bacterium]
MKTLAVIDIGSNTLLVTVGRRQDDGSVRILCDEGEVTRLGQGLSEGGELQPEAKARALKDLARFKELALAKGAERILAAGTAAFRRARDGADFAAEIQDKLGFSVRILSGDEEAHYSFASAWHDFGAGRASLGMIDIGGGSTEFVFGREGPRFSLPRGTVKLTEKFVTGHPIDDTAWAAVRGEIRRLLQENLGEVRERPEAWAAVAATPASLAAVLQQLPAYDPEKVHGFRLRLSALEGLVESLREKGLAERRALPGMHPDRAELLPIGGAILLESMKFLGLGEILVSDHGLRYGILFENL